MQDCRRYVRRFLAVGDVDDVVGDSVVDCLGLLQSQAATFREIETSLKRALNRHRKRFQRYRSRFHCEDHQNRLSTARTDMCIDRDFKREVKRVLRRLVQGVLGASRSNGKPLVSARERRLLGEAYPELAEMGLGVAIEAVKGKRKSESRRKALYRAKLRFSRLLESALVKAFEDAPDRDKHVLTYLLHAVRGGRMGETPNTTSDDAKPGVDEPTETCRLPTASRTLQWDLSMQDPAVWRNLIDQLSPDERNAILEFLNGRPVSDPEAFLRALRHLLELTRKKTWIQF
jgi:hypothetical protein